MSPLTSFVNDGHGGVHHSIHHESSITGTRSGQILWIRGLTRLQTQVGRGPPADDRPTSIDRDRPTLNAALLSRFLSHSFSLRKVRNDRLRFVRRRVDFLPIILLL